MDVITYSLREDQADSDRYYREIAVFAREVTAAARDALGPLVSDYRSFLAAAGREPLRSKTEYLLELMTLGTLWHVYIGSAMRTPAVPRRLLAGLSALRRKFGRFRRVVDPLRGCLTGLFLRPAKPAVRLPAIDLHGLNRLLAWLAAADIFYYEAQRLRPWGDFFTRLSPPVTAAKLESVIDFAAWFEARGAAVLDRYTRNIDTFRRQNCSRWREDSILRCRRPVEYHLNMVGAEMLNQCFRPAFAAAGSRTVLLPACMCLRPNGGCRAKPAGPGYRCAGCTETCRVKRLTELGKTHQFDVYIVPHQSSLFRLETTDAMREGKTGAVGVACVTSLLSGGWMLRAMGIPAQCVLLDYCGCRGHWHSEGIPTDLNTKQLLAVLQTAAPASVAN